MAVTHLRNEVAAMSNSRDIGRIFVVRWGVKSCATTGWTLFEVHGRRTKTDDDTAMAGATAHEPCGVSRGHAYGGEVQTGGRKRPGESEEAARVEIASLRVRFFVVASHWLLMPVSSFLPAHGRRAGIIHAAGNRSIVWALALRPWFWPQVFSKPKVAPTASLNVLAVLFIAIATLPMGLAAIVAMVVASVAGVGALFAATQPLAHPDDVQIIMTFQAGVGLLLLAVSWRREATERRAFTQRAHMRALNEELVRLKAEKNEFMAIAAHDLRGPLAAVRGIAG